MVGINSFDCIVFNFLIMMSALEKELRQLHDGLPKTAEKSHARDSGIPDSRHTTLLGEKSYKSSGAKPKQLKKTTSFLGDDEPSFMETLNELTSRKQRVSSTPYIIYRLCSH